MKCPWCGEENVVGATICAHCGIIWSSENGPKASQAERQREYERQYRPDQPYYQPPSRDLYNKQSNNLVIIAGLVVAALLVLVLIAFAISPPLNGQNGVIQHGPLDGTWSTTQPVVFHIRSDLNNGSLEDIGYEVRNMTFVITGTSNPDVVNVDVYYTIISSQGVWFSLDATRDYCEGQRNGTVFWLVQGDVKAVFTIDDNTMTGTWDDLTHGEFYSQETYTMTNALELRKQSAVVQ